MKAKQHYVSEDRAYVILYRYLTEGNIPDCSLYKYEMYSSLIRCCLDIMKKIGGESPSYRKTCDRETF